MFCGIGMACHHLEGYVEKKRPQTEWLHSDQTQPLKTTFQKSTPEVSCLDTCVMVSVTAELSRSDSGSSEVAAISSASSGLASSPLDVLPLRHCLPLLPHPR